MTSSNFLSKFSKYEYPLFGWVRLPEINISDKERADVGAPIGCDNYEFLRKLCHKGYKDLCPESEKEEWIARIKKELELLKKLGYVDYMLLVWKIINETDKLGIARGPGRGSVAGSLVAYLTRITDVQPIKYKLFFERFVSEARSKKKVVDGITYIDGSLAPDIDIDIEQKRRHEVVENTHKLYPNKVAKISNVATLSGKALIKMCGKVIEEINEEEMKIVSDYIPKKFGIVADLKDAYYGKRSKDNPDEWEQEPVPKFVDWCDKHPKVFKVALKLRGLIKNKSSHASGYIISYRNLDEYIPLEYAKKKKVDSEELSDEKEIVASFTMEDVAYLTIKLDLLGLRCASVIADVLKETKTDLSKVDLDNDPLIYNALQDLRTPHGLFQIEAHTNLQVCREVKPRNLSELSDVLSMARPGALAYVHDYVEGSKQCPHPLFKDILEPTRNTCLFQEQMMQLLHAIGFSLEDAEKVRRIVGKKKIDEMVEWQGKVKEMAKKNGFEESIGEMVWKILDESASYSFNKCLDKNTIIATPLGPKTIENADIGEKILAFDIDSENVHFRTITNKYENKKELFEIEMDDGRKIICSMDHKFLTISGGMKSVKDIISDDLSIICPDEAEYFVDMLGYEGCYLISNFGKIFSKKRKTSKGGFVKPFIDRYGYQRIELSNCGKKKFYVHRLVGINFLPNPENLPVINHKNGIKIDNYKDNLEWASVSDNNNHAYRTGLNQYNTSALPKMFGESHPATSLTTYQVSAIKTMRNEYKIKLQEIADIYNIDQATVSKIALGKTWKNHVL